MPATAGGREVGGSGTGGAMRTGCRVWGTSASHVQPGDAHGQAGPPQAPGRAPVWMHTVTGGPEGLWLILPIWLPVAGEDWGGGEFQFLSPNGKLVKKSLFLQHHHILKLKTQTFGGK